MAMQEAMIFQSAVVNNASVALTILAPTSSTVRDSSFGQAYLVNAMALCSTDDVNRVEITWPGMSDTNGIEVPCVTRYAATASFDLWRSKLPKRIPLPANAVVTVTATSETAANTVCYAWLNIEYEGIGSATQPSPNGSYTTREINAGGALTSNVAASGTALTATLQSGRQYQVVGFMGGGISAMTAGFVGPVYVKMVGPSGYAGLENWIPLANSANYVATGGGTWEDFSQAGIIQPIFNAPCPLTPWFLGYTAEQPEARVILAVDKN